MVEKDSRAEVFVMTALDKDGSCDSTTLTAQDCKSNDVPTVGFNSIDSPYRYWKVKYYGVSDEYALINDQGIQSQGACKNKQFLRLVTGPKGTVATLSSEVNATKFRLPSAFQFKRIIKHTGGK